MAADQENNPFCVFFPPKSRAAQSLNFTNLLVSNQYFFAASRYLLWLWSLNSTAEKSVVMIKV